MELNVDRWNLNSREMAAERERFDYVTTFDLTAEHIALLGRVYVDWYYCETGAPEINPKRPYGNSSVANDIAEILGWDSPDDDATQAEWDAFERRALTLHRQMAVALQVVLNARSFEPGRYVREHEWAPWRLG